MGAYSQYNLLGEEFSEEKGFWRKKIKEWVQERHLKFTLEIPVLFYKRGVGICEDIEKLSGLPFQHHQLLDFVFEAFIIEIRIKHKFKHLYDKLKRAEEECQPMEIYVYGSLQGKQYKQPRISDPLSNKKPLTCFIGRDEVKRCEWFLFDLEQNYPRHGFTVEKVIELFYCDFVLNYQKGKEEETIKKLIKVLKKD